MPIENVLLKCAADADTTVTFCPPRASDVWVLRNLVYSPNATLAADATNYASVRAYKGTGTGTPVVAARTSATVALTKGTVEPIALTGTGADLECTQANPLSVQVTHPGTGGAVDMQVIAEFDIVSRGA